MLSATLDLVLGLSYVFLVLSLIVTSLTELLASWLKWRAADLEKGIKSLLQSPVLAKQFFDHPLIQNLSYNPASQGTPTATSSNTPSYIASRDFASVVYNDICGAGKIAIQTPEQLKALLETVPDEQLKKTLKTLAAEVDHDVDSFKVEIGKWFDRGMDRVSGWYKRRIQWVTLWVGLMIVVLLNANAVEIAQKISVDPKLKADLVEKAVREAADPQTSPDMTVPPSSEADSSEKLSELRDSEQIIGWQSSPLFSINWKEEGATWNFLSIILTNVPGWCLTAIAVSLGAPFWFDMLKQIIAIRGAGKIPTSGDATNSDATASPPT